MIEFEWWNLIPIGIALISLALNIYQFVKRKNMTKPITNSLIGLFNDVKNKNLLCYGKKIILFDPHNPHQNLETLRWDFNDFILSITQSLWSFQEHIVALLKGLEVSDEDVFKAVDFGLTPAEKEVRMGWQNKQKEGMGKSTEPHPTQIEKEKTSAVKAAK